MEGYSELRNDYVDDGKIHIDGWKTSDDDEQGKILATIDIATHQIEWKDQDAFSIAQVHQYIRETIDEIKLGSYE